MKVRTQLRRRQRGRNARRVRAERERRAGRRCVRRFVARGDDDANDGTKERPVSTLAKAVELSAKKGARVYACAETFTEALVLDAGVEVFGGLECEKEWAYVGDEKKTTLTAGADAIPLVMKSGASGASVADFGIHAADAVMEGGSSIAVLVESAVAELVRCELVAGNGAKGSVGAHGDPNGYARSGRPRRQRERGDERRGGRQGRRGAGVPRVAAR
jgi:hypothetical protein